MYIIYQNKKGIEYALLTKSVRSNGKVVKEYVNLGRVIDRERGVYQNRERGVFTYNVEKNEYGQCPEDVVPPKDVKRGAYYAIDRKRYSLLVLRFGDVFFS